MAMEDDGDQKIKDLMKKYPEFYRKFGMTNHYRKKSFFYLINKTTIFLIISLAVFYIIIATSNIKLYEYKNEIYNKIIDFKDYIINIDIFSEKNHKDDFVDEEKSDYNTNRDEEFVVEPKQKIIWQWTGGGMISPSRDQLVSEIMVQSGCKKNSENLEYYLRSGWEIQSTNSAERPVAGGVCMGRDIVISRK